MMDVNSGYIGHSMSRRAAEAYEDGEMPKSKWTKKAMVTVDGHDYEVMKGATYEDSRKVDDLLDSHGDRPISDYRKRPQGMSLKQAVRESREASAKLAENNSGTDAPDGKDER